MIGFLILSHGGYGECLIQTVTHMLGDKPTAVRALGFTKQADLHLLEGLARAAICEVDQGQGVLILTDMFGATPCNLAAMLVEPGRVEAIAGVNAPMLVRAINYRDEPLQVVLGKALAGGASGILSVPAAPQRMNG
jgi:PTS system ascorbate-specific IIA component